MSCFWGHTWKKMQRFSCKAYKGSIFSDQVVRNIPAEITFSQCTKCGEIHCDLTDGSDTTTLNAGFEARKIIAQHPHLVNNPFMRKVAEL